MTPKSRTRIAVLNDYQNAAAQCADWSPLESAAEVAFYHDHLDNRAALIERLKPYDVVCLMRERTKLDVPMLRELPKLKLIVTTAMRNAALDIVGARSLGLTVCGTGAVHHGTPELVWLHILTHARQFEAERTGLRHGRWQVAVGQDLHDATIGIVGLGRVGERVARVANAFGMNVLGWSPNLTEERARAAGARFVSKRELFEQSDFVVLALQLRPPTRGIIGADELNRMKPTGYLINTSRAGLIDESALLRVLREHRIAGAGLDAFDQEPLPHDHPFWTMPNVVLTPHLGYVTRQTYEQFYRETVEDIQAWMRGSPIRVLNGTE